MRTFFVTGTDTGVGKTLVSAILVRALKADYWKPVQAGDLDHTDSEQIRRLTEPFEAIIHKERYRLTSPMSPHAAARIDGIKLELKEFTLPETPNHLVIEGAGGLLVPLNEQELMIDLIAQTGAEIVLVSQNKLGSINHTLLSIEALLRRNLPLTGVLFNGPKNDETESFILRHTGVRSLGNVLKEPELSPSVIENYAHQVRNSLNESFE